MNKKEIDDTVIGIYYRLNKINKISKAAKYKFKESIESESEQDREISDSAFFSMMQDIDVFLNEINVSYSKLQNT